MTSVIIGLQQVIYASFIALALLMARDWIRHRDRSRGSIALALMILAIVVIASDADTLTHTRYQALAIVTQALFPWSGYALLLFRDSLVPLPRVAKRSAGAAVAAVSLAGLYFGAQIDSHGARLPLPTPYYIAWLLIWIGCVGEPIVRLWRESLGRAAVQRARLRALSFGYGLVIAILVFSFATQAEASNPAVQLITQLASLVVVPSLYASFAPPQWLRVLWRQAEEHAFGRSMQELQAFVEQEPLVRHALHWAIRLVGADAAFVRGADGGIVATHGIETGAAAALGDELHEMPLNRPSLLQGPPPRTVIVTALPFDDGQGLLVVVAGPTTPLFGNDEVYRLEQYSTAISAALERVRLVETLRRSEASVRELNRTLEHRVAERTADLEAKTQELEAFSYTVSHDLRAPIRAIDGFAAALLEDYDDELADGARAFMAKIIDNSRSMATLIDTLLAFARLGRQPIKKRRVQPGTVVGRVLATFEQSIADRGVHVTVGRLPECEADPELLERVYANLIGNALKFTAKAARPTVEIGCSPSGERPTSFVRDNGAGFDMAYADKLFAVFQRLHGKNEFEGTGAGLATVQRIVQRHGGRVWGEGVPNGGATFYFTLGASE